MTLEYKSARLDKYNNLIVHYFLREKTATTVTEKKFCRKMIEMYLKRYQWYLK